MLNNWLKIALINYKKNWLSTLINLFGLTIGLTGFMLILMHWNDEESYEQWNPKKNTIYAFQQHNKKDNTYSPSISYPIADRAAKLIPEIKDYVLFSGAGMGFKMTTQNKTVYQKDGMAVSESFFNFFPFKLVSGSFKEALRNENSLAISTKAAKSLFGKTNVAGERVTFDRKNYIITAVYELPEGNSVIKPQFVMLAYEQLKNDKEGWGNFNYGCFFMLDKDADTEAVQEKLLKDVFEYRARMNAQGSGLTPQKYLELYGPQGSLLTPLGKMKLHGKAYWFGTGDLKTMMILFSLSVLIVILSAINFINLKTAQASQRAKEIGVRKAIGSTRLTLTLQFLLETFLICFASYILSLALTELILPGFNKFFDKEIVMNDWHIYFYSLVMILTVTLISGLIPALYLANFKAIETLKGNFARSRHGIWLRNGILTLQLIISSFFIIGGLIVNSQVKHMMNKDLGYNGRQVFLVSFSENSAQPWLKYERIKNEMKKIKGVDEDRKSTRLNSSHWS